MIALVLCLKTGEIATPVMQGRLSEHPLAELVSEIAEKGFSGALRIERERVKAAAYFERGALVYATSNLRVHRLAEYLRQQGSGSARVKESVSDLAVAEEVLAKGLLSRQQLDELLTEQVAGVMRVVLLWTDGVWSFDGRARVSESIQVKVATQQLLLEAARRLDPKLASARLTNSREAVCHPPSPPGALNLLPAEAFMLSRVEGAISVDDLIALSGLSEPDAKRMIYGLLLARLLQREFWQHAFRTPPPQTTKARIDKAAPDNSSPAATAKSPAQTAKAPAEPPPDPQRELYAFLERLSQAANHYEVLNVPLSADPSEIKRAYHTIARNFHPDRFHDLTGSVTHTRLQSSFARITQAYETLTSPDLRTAYDANIQALRRVRETQQMSTRAEGSGRDESDEKTESGDNVAQLAEKRFQEGAAALQQGQTNAAVACFSAAARLAPNQPKYRAYFGRALAANPKTRREAEAELQAAVTLAPTNAAYHVMLAVLYRDLGFARRALTEAQRALKIDGENSQARQLLESLAK